MKPTFCLHLLLLVILAIVGCVPASLPPTPTQTETQLPSPTTAPPTSTLIPTPTPAATLTLLPSLEPEQAKERIRTLLLESLDCSAPCFWGIVPGQTTLSEAKDIFNHLGVEIESTTYEGKDFYGIRYDFDSGLSVIVTLTVQDEIVENLRVDIATELQQEGVKRGWLAYSPETLITRYGKPAQVVFALDWGPRSYFEMNMYFDEVDLIVEYMGHNIIPRQKGSSQVCPLASQFESVRLWMGKVPVYPPAEAVPLQDATDMTIEEFSNLMTGNPNEACFIVKGEVFP